jgi:hypothetical protein
MAMPDGMYIDVVGRWYMPGLDRQVLGRQAIAAIEDMMQDGRPSSGAQGSSVLSIDGLQVITHAQCCRDGIHLEQRLVAMPRYDDSQQAGVVE